MKFSFPSLLCFALVLCAFLPAMADTGATASNTSPSVNQSAAVVDGFRSAKFGMDLAQVKKAAETDLQVTASTLQVTTDPKTLTTSVSATVPGLVPGLGKAMVNYVLGYKSHELDTVIVTWDSHVDSANNPKALIRGGTILQDYFAKENFSSGHAYGNRLLKDGDFILFHGEDAGGRAVTLALRGNLSKPEKAANDTKGKVIFTPHAVVVGYFANPVHPDIYALPQGSF